MKFTKIFTTAALALIASVCLAQTGILDQNAEYRRIPPEAAKYFGQKFKTVRPQAAPAPQAPRPGQMPPQAPASQPGQPQMQSGQPQMQPGQPQPGQPQMPQRKVYAPVGSDSLNINPAIDSLNRTRSERPVAGSHRRGSNPELFLIGDSTMRTEVDGNGSNGQWGWGYFLENYFNTDKITVENHGLGGESMRSYYKNLLWPLLHGLKPGDWVIIQLGHNDRHGAEMDNGRFRGILPGMGKEYTEVTLQGNGTRERVYTYGEYLRMYIDEIRAKGANPLLLSLTSRNNMGTDGKYAPDSNTDVIKAIAEEKGVPFIDFNAAIRNKYENVFNRKKVEYLYFSDGIHSSSFGAIINAETFVEELRKRPDIGLSQYLLPASHYESAARVGNKPVLFIIGDSTAKIDASDKSGKVGWAQVFGEYVNSNKITVDNQAKAGRSARTYLDEGRWNVVYDELRPGDYVLIQFGHNDGGPINIGKARGELTGNSDDKQVMTMEASGINEGIYSFGWYIRKFCLDAEEKGAIPIVMSITPRNMRDKDGKIIRDTDYKAWSKEAAAQAGAYFIDLNEISAAKLDKMTKEQADAQFRDDHTHSSAIGAERNAKSVAEGIKGLKSLKLRKMIK